jgi:hypothetical protein
LNRNLLVVALFLVLLGLGSNTYLVSFFGLLLLIPALLSSPRPRQRPVPSAVYQRPRRIAPQQMPPPRVSPPSPQPQPQPQATATPPAAPTQTPAYSPALLPNSMFPPIFPSVYIPKPTSGASAEKAAERDELVEAGAILALLRLFLG